jgi:hypothetical protein
MPIINFALPVIPGREDRVRQFAGQVNGPKNEDFKRFLTDSTTARESWTLQSTPGGSFLLVWFEAADIAKGFELLAHDDSEFVCWFRDEIRAITGIDLTDDAGSPQVDSLVDCVVARDWSST